MTTRSRFATSTVICSERPVPWLAAQGPLAYSPEEPPATDYFFQYSWILPGIFDPKINLREHRYFGSRLKRSARFLFDFWGNIRKGNGAARQRYSHWWRRLGARSNSSMLCSESGYFQPLKGCSRGL
jgi:hypothetical protein